MESVDDIDSLEDLVRTLTTQLDLKDKQIINNKSDIEKQETLKQESEKKLVEEERLLKSVEEGFSLWGKAAKIKEHKDNISGIKSDINKYKTKLEELRKPETEREAINKNLEENKKKLKKLKEEENKTTEEPWRLIKDSESVYCQRIKEYFLHRFNTLNLPESLSKWKEGDSSKFVNIILIGSTGCGKSSFINTCKTALQNSGDMAFASVDQGSNLPSATIRLVLAPLRFSNGVQPPIRLFDCRGIQKNIGYDVIKRVISGHIKPNTKISGVQEMEAESSYNMNPTIYNEMHCIVYVARADKIDTQTKELHESLHDIRQIRKLYTEKNIPQCVLVTYFDKIIPSKNMKHVFHYPVAKRLCGRAANIFQIPLKYIYPMSNYHDEGAPTLEKDAIALDILWKITRMAMDHLDNHENRSNTLEGFYD